MPSSSDLEKLAASIADGDDADWSSVQQSAATDDDRATIAAFRELAVVQGLFAAASTDLAQASARPRMEGGTSWGSLQIEAHVGRGRFGDVYRAWDPALERRVALKLIDDDDLSAPARADVIAEGRLMARVRHPNVVAIHGAQLIDGVTGLSMEFVDGETLEQELAARGPFAADALVATGVQVCRALAAVHAAGLVHRDVKPSNILRERASGRIMLGDFGTGYVTDDADSPCAMAGTPAYMAPEVLARQPATARSDIYGVGVLLFRLATSGYPYNGRSIGALRAAHASEAPPHLAGHRPDLPHRLVAIVDRALERDPGQRFASAAAMADALETCLGRGLFRRRVLTAGVAAALLVAAGAAAYWLRPAPPVRLGEHDAVLVTRFENRTGETALDGVLEHALELELAGSGSAAVVSRERVTDTLALMHRLPDTVVDVATGREIAQRDGRIGLVVTGQVDRIGGSYRISARMMNPVDGSTVGAATATAASIDGVLQAVSRLGRDVRTRLGETLPRLTRPDGALPKVRTQSFAALKLYAAALPDLHRDANPAVARQLLVEALKQDPGFTFAHVALARAIWEQRPEPMTQETADDILASLTRASALVADGDAADRHIVEAESGLLRGLLAPGAVRRDERRAHFEQALKAAELWLRLQPSSERAMEVILDLHGGLNRPAASDLPLVRKLVELRPHSLEALRRAAGRCSLARSFPEARQYLARAKPLLDLPEAGSNSRRAALDVRTWLIDDAWVRGDLREALQIAAELRGMLDAAEPAAASFYAPAMFFMYLVLGQLDRAEDAAARITHDDRLRRLLTLSVLKHRGDMQRLRDAIPQAFPDAWLAASPGLAGLRADVAIHTGRLATARLALNDMRRYGTNADVIPFHEARLALAEGNPAKVIAMAPRLVAPPDHPFITGPEPDRVLLLARAYSDAGRPQDAIRTLEALSSRPREIRYPGINGAPYWMALRDRLAQLYRDAGRVPDAEPIEADLRKWLAAADPDHPIVRRLGAPATAASR